VHLSPRPGFTLAELLVAVVLANVGLLALVGGSAALVRRHSAIRAQGIAAEVAASRIELLASGSCDATAAATGAASRADGISERWSIAPAVNRTREAADSVSYWSAGERKVVVVRTRVPC
jgi:Tfp pilus assembly protein PilV